MIKLIVTSVVLYKSSEKYLLFKNKHFINYQRYVQDILSYFYINNSNLFIDMSMTSLSSENIDSSSEEDIRPRPRTFFERKNPLNIYNDQDFKYRYRINKNTFMEIFDLIKNNLEPATRRNKSIPGQLQLLIALRFYATGAFQQLVGDDIGIHKSTISRIICKVTRQIAALPTTVHILPLEIPWNDVSEF